jgi:hypothetical protein
MRFVADTKEYGLRIKPDEPSKDKFNWNMVVYTDSDLAKIKKIVRVSLVMLFSC